MTARVRIAVRARAEMPGLLNSVTSVLLEDDCNVDSLDADVVTLGMARPVFFVKGSVGVRADVDPGLVFEKLAAWAVEHKAKLAFDPPPGPAEYDVPEAAVA